MTSSRWPNVPISSGSATTSSSVGWQEKRAIMTNNVRDFVPLATRAALEAGGHVGLLLTSDRSMPRRLEAIGRFVDVLDSLRHHEGEDSYRRQIRWLNP
jgi:hypothetical protein